MRLPDRVVLRTTLYDADGFMLRWVMVTTMRVEADQKVDADALNFDIKITVESVALERVVS